MQMFCPACGDIMQTAKSIHYIKSKGLYVVYCFQCGKAFLYSPLSDKETHFYLRKQLKHQGGLSE